MKTRLQAWGNQRIVHIANCLVLNGRGELLLLQRHRDDLGGGKWGTPGGRLEPNEFPKIAAVRELYEETGLRVVNVALLGAHKISMPHGAVHMTTFLTRLPGTPTIQLDPEEHEAYQWLGLHAILHAPDLLWGIPTLLRDFDLLDELEDDPTLSDGSQILLLEKAS